MSKSKQNGLFKTTALLTFIIAASKLLGFVREAVLAAEFGQSIEKSAYLVSFQILSVFTMFFSAGIASTFIPIYSKRRVMMGEKAANAYASNILNLYILCALGAGVLGYFFAGQIGKAVWGGSGEGLLLIDEMTRIMMPSLACWAIVGVLTNLLNARKHFVPEQLMGFVLSFTIIIACLVFKNIKLVAAATAVSALFQVIALAPFLKGRFHYSFKLDIKDKDLIKTFVLAAPALVSVAFDELNVLVDSRFASSLGDNVPSAVNESFRLVQPILGVLVVPIITVMFTQLSDYMAKKEEGGFKKTVRKSIETIAFVTFPVMAVAFILQDDIISLFYQRGNYTLENALFTAPVFGAYIVGVFSFGLRNFLVRVFYSLQKTKFPMIIGIIGVGINIILTYVLMRRIGAPGITLGTSIAVTVSAVAMLIVLRKTVGRMGARESAIQFLRIIICAAACAVVVLLLNYCLPYTFSDFMSKLLHVFVCGAAGLAAYASLAYLLKVSGMGMAVDYVKRKFSKRKPGAEPPANP